MWAFHDGIRGSEIPAYPVQTASIMVIGEQRVGLIGLIGGE
jgi:hypothetical protein